MYLHVYSLCMKAFIECKNKLSVPPALVFDYTIVSKTKIELIPLMNVTW